MAAGMYEVWLACCGEAEGDTHLVQVNGKAMAFLDPAVLSQVES
jgi:hypothetical protein